MSVVKHDAFTRLRQAIRQSGRQYRRADDNSRNLFHPAAGWMWAYDIEYVEKALDAYEQTLPADQRSPNSNLTIEQQLIKEAQSIQGTHDDIEIRDFARTVIAYLVLARDPSDRVTKLRAVRSAPDIQPKDLL